MKKRIILLPTIIFFTLTYLMIAGCSSKIDDVSQERSIPRSVVSFKIEEEEIRDKLEGFGNLSFRRKADIISAVDGTIQNIFVEEGDKVSDNQLLASLFNIQLEIREKQAEAALFSAESAYELTDTQYKEGRLRAECELISIEKSVLKLNQKELELEHRRELLEKEFHLLSIGGTTEEEAAAMKISFSALETEIMILEKDIEIQKTGFRDKDIRLYGYDVPRDQKQRTELLLDINSLTLKSERKVAEARVRSAITELESARALLEETNLVSPIDGIVGAKYMETGERIKSNEKIFTVFDSSVVDLLFSVPEEIGVLLNQGQKVEVSLDAVKDRIFTAEIRLINPTIDTRSGNISIKAELQNSEGLFRPGMFSRFSLIYGSPKTLIRLPSEALLRKDGERGLVIKIKNNRAFPQEITVGPESDGLIEITSGLTAGDIIILNPSPLLKEGDPVDVK